MDIHQISVNYLTEHDRILLRINSTDGQELRLWFTHRLCVAFRPNLNRIVTQWVGQQEAVKNTHISPSATADLHTQQMLSEFKREESLSKANFKTPYVGAKSMPLGAEPLLVTEISVTPLASGHLQILFSEKLPGMGQASLAAPRSFRISLEQKLVHGLMHLLDQAWEQSQWGSRALAGASGSASLSAEDAMGIDPNARPRYLN